ncbi:hypothetical protein Pst134EA_004737 [Puccinia striiformis f. sp. tritici]|uniref:hypothetical protein n=1 Tax=Puccinia striiformis f. sp. tritici TaxID=168172 RepID=UPI002008C1F1|nr:hypothetical protein Pst134EA_004737 [Puccinia striiformis f. sp. tritici]KAH9470818.1 hypothetical protein Pst134EA_004737 [Puccinia striiformis f. sp. tritici]
MWATPPAIAQGERQAKACAAKALVKQTAALAKLSDPALMRSRKSKAPDASASSSRFCSASSAQARPSGASFTVASGCDSCSGFHRAVPREHGDVGNEPIARLAGLDSLTPATPMTPATMTPATPTTSAPGGPVISWRCTISVGVSNANTESSLPSHAPD